MGDMDAEVDAEKWIRVGGQRLENKDKSYDKKELREEEGDWQMEIRGWRLG